MRVMTSLRHFIMNFYDVRNNIELSYTGITNLVSLPVWVYAILWDQSNDFLLKLIMTIFLVISIIFICFKSEFHLIFPMRKKYSVPLLHILILIIFYTPSVCKQPLRSYCPWRFRNITLHMRLNDFGTDEQY